MTTPTNNRDAAIVCVRLWAKNLLPPEWRAVAEWQIAKGQFVDKPNLPPHHILDWAFAGHMIPWHDVARAARNKKRVPKVPDWLADLIAKDATTPQVRQPIAPEPLPSVEKALEIVHGAREQEYGHPADDLARIGRIWTAILGGRRDPVDAEHPLTAREVANLMIGLKLARLGRTPDHADSLADVVGYVVCSDRIGNREAGR